MFIILDRKGSRVLSAQGGSQPVRAQGPEDRGCQGGSMVRKKRPRSLGRIYKAERAGLAACLKVALWLISVADSSN